MMCRYCQCDFCGKKYHVAAVFVNCEFQCRVCNNWFRLLMGGPLVFRPDLPSPPHIDDLINRN